MNSAYTATYKDSSAFKIFVIEAASAQKANAMIAEYLHAVPIDAVTKLDPGIYQIPGHAHRSDGTPGDETICLRHFKLYRSQDQGTVSKKNHRQPFTVQDRE